MEKKKKILKSSSKIDEKILQNIHVYILVSSFTNEKDDDDNDDGASDDGEKRKEKNRKK